MSFIRIDQLAEALAEWDRLSIGKDARLAYPLLEIVSAARAVVEGDTLAWCDQHDEQPAHGRLTNNCPMYQSNDPCHVVMKRLVTIPGEGL